MPTKRLRMTAVLAALAMLALMAPTATAQDEVVPVDAIGDAIGDTGATIDDVTIQRLTYDRASGQMLANGVVEYTTATGDTVTQDFRRVPLQITEDSSGELSTQQTTGSCDILTLDLGPIFLDLLGLQVDLSAIELDITAVPGSGNLLGNLLCAVAGLLDPGSGLGGLGGLVDQLLNGLTRLLNQLLRGLGGLSLA